MRAGYRKWRKSPKPQAQHYERLEGSTTPQAANDASLNEKGAAALDSLTSLPECQAPPKIMPAAAMPAPTWSCTVAVPALHSIDQEIQQQPAKKKNRRTKKRTNALPGKQPGDKATQSAQASYEPQAATKTKHTLAQWRKSPKPQAQHYERPEVSTTPHAANNASQSEKGATALDSLTSLPECQALPTPLPETKTMPAPTGYCTVAVRKIWHRPHWPVPLPPALHSIDQEIEQSPAKKKNRRTKKRTNALPRKQPDDKATQSAQASYEPQAATKTKHTLALDIDDTLLRYSDTGRHENKRLETFYVTLRPHVGTFLKEIHELFEVVMYTAAVPSYGAAMTNLLENAAGLPPSSYYDATVPWGCFDSRDKVNAEEANAMRYAPVLGKDQVNWYLLTGARTLNSDNFDRVKYLPILGRDPDSTIIIDDNERSFPLNPRAGIKVARMGYNDDDDDDALLQLLPMLRAVAAAPSALHELDHWRADEYVKCDNFADNIKFGSEARKILGTVLNKRRESPITAMIADSGNAKLLEDATRITEILWNASKTDVDTRRTEEAAFSKS